MAAMLTVSGLHAYYGQAHILADVALQVNAGEVVVLLGRNGAGKSTTLKSIIGLVRPKSGTVEFGGTVKENLEVGRQPARAGVPAWDWDKLGALFPNLREMPDRKGGHMSGGEQQMLTIARTLMGNPACILLDEPSEGVAPVIVDQMAQAIRELKAAGVAILLSEQNLHFAMEVADRAYIIEKGRIRFAGTMAELSANDDVRAQYLAV